jgi:hypothetical protein
MEQCSPWVKLTWTCFKPVWRPTCQTHPGASTRRTHPPPGERVLPPHHVAGDSSPGPTVTCPHHRHLFGYKRWSSWVVVENSPFPFLLRHKTKRFRRRGSLSVSRRYAATSWFLPLENSHHRTLLLPRFLQLKNRQSPANLDHAVAFRHSPVRAILYVPRHWWLFQKIASCPFTSCAATRTVWGASTRRRAFFISKCCG